MKIKKAMKNLKLILTTAVFATFFSCVNGDDYGTPADNCTDLVANVTVQSIASAATSTAVSYGSNDDIIEAYVTSSDQGGNFYKSISFSSIDGTVGFSVPVDNYNLYTKYEPGRKVFIKMQDRFFNTQNNSTVIGSDYAGGVGRISGVEYQSIITRSCTKVNEDDIVKHLTITQAKNNQYLNMLIEFDAVQFSDASTGKMYFDETVNNLGGATNHLITDVDGNTIIVRVSEYASFATNIIPNKNGKIRGVLTKYGSDYQFMVRTLNDVKLTNNRVVPLFEETFSNNYASWTKFSVSGTPAWVLDTQYGNPGNCAKMSGYASSGQTANEDWLISPSIDLSSVSSATLTFQTASKFAGNVLEAKISTNYSGSGNPTSATWTNLTATYDTNTGSYIWTNSGNIDLSAYTGGSVYIGFKYTCTASAASTWEVDNVKIQ
ncbi:DUF5689 domain-containing protein [Flavobacterium sp. N2270]|uniref:DUF5689 domain-containing protein n=1 Tax=Flavobacterium sp. N2270 TaxID=2986831 RepID=UPI0022246B3C|nr:DUF5689 domain-containing protein [Flavobacterium sp. N2270]